MNFVKVEILRDLSETKKKKLNLHIVVLRSYKILVMISFSTFYIGFKNHLTIYDMLLRYVSIH